MNLARWVLFVVALGAAYIAGQHNAPAIKQPPEVRTVTVEKIVKVPVEVVKLVESGGGGDESPSLKEKPQGAGNLMPSDPLERSSLNEAFDGPYYGFGYRLAEYPTPHHHLNPYTGTKPREGLWFPEWGDKEFSDNHDVLPGDFLKLLQLQLRPQGP